MRPASRLCCAGTCGESSDDDSHLGGHSPARPRGMANGATNGFKSSGAGREWPRHWKV